MFICSLLVIILSNRCPSEKHAMLLFRSVILASISCGNMLRPDRKPMEWDQLQFFKLYVTCFEFTFSLIIGERKHLFLVPNWLKGSSLVGYVFRRQDSLNIGVSLVLLFLINCYSFPLLVFQNPLIQILLIRPLMLFLSIVVSF